MIVIVVLLLASEKADTSVSNSTAYTAREKAVFPDIKCLPLSLTVFSCALCISKFYFHWHRTMTVARQSYKQYTKEIRKRYMSKLFEKNANLSLRQSACENSTFEHSFLLMHCWVSSSDILKGTCSFKTSGTTFSSDTAKHPRRPESSVT
jgi:hypothetical protein